MNASIFWRVFWKEFRLQWPLWLAMAALTVLAQFAVIAYESFQLRSMAPLYLIAVALPSLYALGCGATLFAGEHEADTFEFQRSLPVHPLLIFVGKIAFAIVSAAALWGFAMGAVWLWKTKVNGTVADWGPKSWQFMTWATFGFFGIETLLWAVFFSILTKRVLPAAVFGVTTASVIAHLAAARSIFAGGEPYVAALPWRGSVVLVLLFADIWLAARWFRERRQRSVSPSQPVIDWTGVTRPVEFSQRLCGPSRTATFFRLVWQHWRQSTWTTAAVLGGMCVPLIVVVVRLIESRHLSPDDPVSHFLGLFPLIAMYPLLGLCVFSSDHRKGRLRFLCDCGVPPKYVWWSRQCILLPLAVLMIPVILSMLLITIESHWQMLRHEALGGYGIICACAIGYAIIGVTAGQLCSMFIRSTLLAAIFSILLTTVLVAWCALMLFWHISIFWSILPIPVALLLATRLHTADWLLERNGPRTWLRPGLVLLVPTVALLIAVPQYRINQIPVLGPDLYFSEYQGTATPEERATIDLYRKADAKYTEAVGHKDDRATQEAIAMMVKASRQPLLHPIAEKWPLSQVRAALETNALKEQAKGNLDAALEQYLAVIRIAGQMRQCDWYARSWLPADSIEAAVYGLLVQWTACPKQTPERIAAAERQLREAIPRLTPTDAAKMQYSVLRRAIDGDLGTFNLQDEPDARQVYPIVQFWSKLPWERERALRLLNFETRCDHGIGMMTDEIARGLYTTPSDRETNHSWVRIRSNLHAQRNSELLTALRNMLATSTISCNNDNDDHNRMPTLVESNRAVETARRAARVVLALQAWKLKHGSLPKSLDELVGTYLDSVPTDPYSGEPFRYFPKGLKLPLSSQGPFDGRGTFKANCKTAADQPFIWSTGENVNHSRESTDDAIVGQYCVRMTDLPYQRPLPGSWYRPRSEYEIWQAGWPFPIP